jgi:hypothetical protein
VKYLTATNGEEYLTDEPSGDQNNYAEKESENKM